MTPTQLTGPGPWNLSTLPIANPGPIVAGMGYYDKATLLWHAYTDAEIAALNAPPPAPFAEYVIAPTSAKFEGLAHPDGTVTMQASVNPLNLSTAAQANAMAAALGVGPPTDMSASEMFTANGEERRLFVLMIGGAPHYAGELMAGQNAHGVGAPGHWETSGTAPVWVADPIPPLVPVPPPPMAQLPAGFHIQAQVIGDPLIVRDRPATIATGTGPVTDGFHQEDRDRLSRIEDKLDRIITGERIP